MSETNNNNSTLRPAINTVSIVGNLKKMDLKEDTGDNGAYISGNLVLETAPHNEISINVYVNKMSKAAPGKPSEENRAYKGIVKVMNEYVSMAKLMEQGANEEDARQQCTKVACNRAQITLNEYWREQDDAWQFTPRARGQYFSQVNGTFEPSARFEIEGFLSAKKPEMKMVNGESEETGRLLVDLIVPVYGGKVIPLSFVCTPEASSYIADHYDIDSTIHVFGNMVATVETIVNRTTGFAKVEETVTHTYKNELLIDNGDPEPYDEDSQSAYKKDAILAAVRIRDTEYLPALKERQLGGKKVASAPAGGGFASGNAPKSSSPFAWGAKN